MDDCKNIAVKIFEYIIEKEEKTPEEIILDFDSSDIEIYGVSNYDLAKYIENNLNFDQLILECWDGIQPNSGWVHVSYVNDVANRKDVLTYTRAGGYTKGII